MKIEKNLLPGSIVEFIVEEETENVAKYRKQAIEHMGKNTDIKGFRKGTKIPEAVLVRKFGDEYINRLTIDFAIDGIYRDTLRTAGVIPVAQGEIKEIISQSPLIVKIHIEILPTVEIDSNGNWQINPEILKKVIKDEKGNIYRIVQMEYDFLMKHGLPLPEIHWLDRIKMGFKFK